MKQEEVIMMVEKTSDYYDAYSVNCDGIYAAGKSIEEVRSNTIEAIKLFKAELPEEQWPEQIKGDFSLQFKFDTHSFLEYYRDYISLSGLEKITGINQKQLSNYLNRRSSPRKEQKERINNGIKRFAKELMDITV